MHNRILLLLLFVVFFGSSCSDQKGESDNNNGKEVITMNRDSLIPREVLFGNPDKITVRISPDGQHISFLAPKDGILNVWVAPVGNIDAAIAITDDKKRGIRSYFWAKNNTHIIFAQDKDGDENWHLSSINIKTLKETLLSPKGKIRAGVTKISSKYPDEILVTVNDRVPEYFDIYKVNIITGKRESIYENKAKFSYFIADDDLKVKIGYKMLENGEGEIYTFKDDNLQETELLQKIPVEDMVVTQLLHITNDGNFVYMTDSIGRNTSGLVKVNLENQQKHLIHVDDKADINDYLVDPKSKEVQAVAVEYLQKQWSILDDSIKSDLKYLEKLDNGNLEIISRSEKDGLWIAAFIKDNGPISYYLYDRNNKKAEFLFVSNSKQQGLPFTRMYPVKIKSRDGLTLVSYLSLPRWLDNGSGKLEAPLPMVLYVHGGPNHRDYWGYSPVHQWLANRNYAVLSVNYRGSTGFGKNFINAGDGQWGGKMHDDLVDAVNWAIDNKIAQKDKIAIMGGSYGGYATLVGMTMTPDLFAAGIDIVGISNLETFIKSIPPYWKPYSAHLTKMLGASDDTAEGREFLKQRSPITYSANIKKPLMIVQGANDPRVNQAESDQIVEAMKKHSIPVLYLLYPDEGHGLARPENRMSFYSIAEMFLAKFLEGDFVPHDNKFPGSSIQIKEGESFVE